MNEFYDIVAGLLTSMSTLVVGDLPISKQQIDLTETSKIAIEEHQNSDLTREHPLLGRSITEIGGIPTNQRLLERTMNWSLAVVLALKVIQSLLPKMEPMQVHLTRRLPLEPTITVGQPSQDRLPKSAHSIPPKGQHTEERSAPGAGSSHSMGGGESASSSSGAGGSSSAGVSSGANESEERTLKGGLSLEQQQVQALMAHPKLSPFLKLLAPKDQVNFLKATVKIQHDEKGRRPTNVASKELPLVDMLSRLTTEQQAELLKKIASRVDENPTTQSSIRFNALKYFPNYTALSGFSLPDWTEDLDRFVNSPTHVAKEIGTEKVEIVPGKKKTASAVTTQKSSSTKTRKKAASTSTAKKASLTAPALKQEKLKRMDLEEKKMAIKKIRTKNQSARVLKKRGLGLTPKNRDDER